MLNPLWTLFYFNICLDCDCSILESIHLNFPYPDRAYAIWSRIPNNSTKANLVPMAKEIVRNFLGLWGTYFRDHAGAVFLASSYYLTNVHVRIHLSLLGDDILISEAYRSPFDKELSSWEMRIDSKNDTQVILKINSEEEIVSDQFRYAESLNKKILRAHCLLKCWKEKLSKIPDYV